MASIAATVVSIPTFTGLKVQVNQKVAVKTPAPVVAIAPRASLKSETLNNVATAAAAAAISLTLASGAFAAEIGMGLPNGALAFDPPLVKVSPGEPITYTNVAGFPHNVVFVEDEVPGGIDVDAISHDDSFNSKGEKWTLVLEKKGEYNYICEPHAPAGMKGKIIVDCCRYFPHISLRCFRC